MQPEEKKITNRLGSRRLFHIEQSDQGPNCLSETRRVDSNHELNEKCFMYTFWRSITLNSSLTIV